jgi:hypothetical protein
VQDLRFKMDKIPSWIFLFFFNIPIDILIRCCYAREALFGELKFTEIRSFQADNFDHLQTVS